MSGNPTGSCALVWTAVVIHPPRSRAFPKPDLGHLAADGVLRTSLAESIGRQKPTGKSKFRCCIIKIGAKLGFWKAALQIPPYFRRSATAACPARHFSARWGVVSSRTCFTAPRDSVTSFLDPLIAFV